MADRIDGLGHRPERNELFSGELLSDGVDDALQRLVERAAANAGTPIALVSLVLDRIQYFKAHYGLPDELILARATDRDVSFCQFVVRDEETFEVNTASTDPRVPQDLVERYGIAAYLGCPVRTPEGVVGSLCVIDTVNRGFTDEQRRELTALAAQVSARLGELAQAEAMPSVLEQAASPAFSEVRNVLTPLLSNIAAAKVAAAELGPLARLATSSVEERERALGALQQAAESVAFLRDCLGDLETVTRRLTSQFEAIESLCIRRKRTAQLEDVCLTAISLSHHAHKVVGGVLVEVEFPDVELEIPSHNATAILAAVLASAAERSSLAGVGDGIRLDVETDPAWVRVNTLVSLPITETRAIARAVRRGTGDLVNLVAGSGCISLAFPRVA